MCVFASAYDGRDYRLGPTSCFGHPSSAFFGSYWSAHFKARKSRIAEGAMNAEYIVTGIIALLLLGYLMVALLKPEKF